MKRLITLAAIAAIALASCTEKPEFQVTPAGQENMASVSSTVFSATTEGAVTKTTLSGDDDNGYVVNWQENDRIVVVDGDDHFGSAVGEDRRQIPVLPVDLAGQRSADGDVGLRIVPARSGQRQSASDCEARYGACGLAQLLADQRLEADHPDGLGAQR